MVEKFKLFFKIIIYSLTVFRSLSAEYTKFDCVKLIDKNFSIICKSYSNENSILPVENIPHDTDTLIIKTPGNGSLTITRADIFQNFKHLQNLHFLIGRSPHITEELLDSVSIIHLKEVLFDIPTLKTLSIKYYEFNAKNYSWILPSSLEKLYLSNGVFEFDLLNCPRLVSLRLYRNNLNKIPPFCDPLPSLEVLDLKQNPLNEFNVNDIAGLCDLKYFAMDLSHITNCECNRLKQWVTSLQKLREFTFNGQFNCNDTIDSSSNCTLEEATLRNEKCPKGWTWTKKKILLAAVPPAVGAVLVLACCFLFCFCVCVIIWSSVPDLGHTTVYAPAYAPAYPPYSPYAPFPPYSPYQPYPAPMPYPAPVPVPLPVPVPVPYDAGSGADTGGNDPGYGGRGGDDFYSGENDAPDNADNDGIFGVKICDRGVS